MNESLKSMTKDIPSLEEINDIDCTASSPLMHSSQTDLEEVKKLIEQIEMLEADLKNMRRDGAWYHHGKRIPLKDRSLNCVLFALESEILDRKIQIQKLNKDVI